eukprot:59538_1
MAHPINTLSLLLISTLIISAVIGRKNGDNCNYCSGWSECKRQCNTCGASSWVAYRGDARNMCNGQDVEQKDVCAIYQKKGWRNWEYKCCTNAKWDYDDKKWNYKCKAEAVGVPDNDHDKVDDPDVFYYLMWKLTDTWFIYYLLSIILVICIFCAYSNRTRRGVAYSKVIDSESEEIEENANLLNDIDL